jgi:hypothetical protein
MKTKSILTALSAAILLAYGTASSANVVLSGNYVQAGVNDSGTLGSGGWTSPGILYDPTGTSSYGVNDYLTPGTPWEGFYVGSTETGIVGNNNNGGGSITATALATDSSAGSSNQASWSGSYGGLFDISHIYQFNDGDARINISTTITALGNLTNLSFLRTLDPDPDVNTYGSFYTQNSRGTGSLAPNDYVYALGPSTGLPISLYSNSSVTHNTGISSDWSTDPNFYLAGTDNGNGDYTIGLAFFIDSLSLGQSVTLNYAYVMGNSLATIDVPPVATPIPAALFMFAPGILGLFGYEKRRKNRALAQSV